MKSALRLYQYLGPLVLTPLSLLLWWREYRDPLQAVAVWLVPVLWAYIVPGIGTNVCKVWEFDVSWKLGRFRPHHGFVFGSATSMLAWLSHGNTALSFADLMRQAFVLCAVLGFWNLLYDIKALRIGLLRVYNQAWAAGQGPEAIALDYSPWFFGGFGAAYGAFIGATELYALDHPAWTWPAMLGFAGGGLLACIALPVLGFMQHSIRRHGHPGTRPIHRERS
ncbi:MAG: hypothetical protein D3M94_07560 [Rhodocyclales bacterium GT-UBC]|nr:MAG: hypothetical protein D3M94_07560 [Rhodocyclales bacterium GT-UBC]